MAENIRSALGRGLPEAGRFRAHDRLMAVAGGGPSLADTWHELQGVVVAVNGSLGFLLERGLMPWACGVCDPNPHMADIVEPRAGVFYFVASCCDPAVFDRLRGCDVVLWHLTGPAEPILAERGGDWLAIGGGCTMGLRWLNLAHAMGFRKFHLHGLDSSFRGGATHAYPDRQDARDSQRLTVEGYPTRLNFLAQVSDFFKVMERFAQPDLDPIGVELFGDGLLQHLWRRRPEGAFSLC